MKAAYFTEHGGPEKIVYDDYNDPVPGPGEVLVRVWACAMNHVDLLLLELRQNLPDSGGLRRG
ncbi:MAG: hypothetical protein ACE5GO_11495 [Anaerolineales bacterium]